MVGSANIDELLWVSIAYVLARVRDRRQGSVFAKFNRVWKPNAKVKKVKVQKILISNVHPMVTRNKSRTDPLKTQATALSRSNLYGMIKTEGLSQSSTMISQSSTTSMSFSPDDLAAGNDDIQPGPSSAITASNSELARFPLDSKSALRTAESLPQRITADLLLVRMATFQVSWQFKAEWGLLVDLLHGIMRSPSDALKRENVRTTKALARFLVETAKLGVRHAVVVREQSLLFAQNLTNLCQWAILNDKKEVKVEMGKLLREPLLQWLVRCQPATSARARTGWQETRQLLHVVIDALDFKELVLLARHTIMRTYAEIMQSLEGAHNRRRLHYAIAELDALSAHVIERYAAVPYYFVEPEPAVIVANAGTDLQPSTSKGRNNEVITLEALREHIACINHQRDSGSDRYECSVCDRVLAYKGNLVRHLQGHLDATFHPFKCPAVNCGYTSALLDNVQRHVAHAHNAQWSNELKDASTDPQRLAAMQTVLKDLN